MTCKPSVRARLRSATAGDHDRVDEAFGAFDLRDRSRYVGFLQAQASAFVPVEASLDQSGATLVLKDWPARKRSAMLRSDLEQLGAMVPTYAKFPALDGPSEVLGAIYVLEGSRLGGSLLVRKVPDCYPRSFLSAANPAGWRSLVELLDNSLKSEADIVAAINAARSVFARFEEGALHQGKAGVR